MDLIICYDAQKSPIRLIQRMGRTGRKRAGRIIILLTEGKEEAAYNTSLSKKKNIYKTILNSAKSLKFYENNPPMLPKKPKCHKMFISVVDDLNDVETKKSDLNTEGEEIEEKEAENTVNKKKSKPRGRKSAKSLDKDENKLNISDEESNDAVMELKKPKARSRKKEKSLEKGNDNNIINENVEPKGKSLKTTTYVNDQMEDLINDNASKDKPIEAASKLNNNSKKVPIRETNQACFVPNVPDPKILRNINRITSETFNEIKIDELIKQWQTDDDDFLFGASKLDVTSNNSLNCLNQSRKEPDFNKYQEFYDKFVSNVSLKEDDDSSDCNGDDMITDGLEDERMEPEYHDVIDDELIEDNFIKNLDFNVVEQKNTIAQDSENINDVEMKSIVNDTLTYEDIQEISNKVATSRSEVATNFKISSLVANKQSAISNANTDTTENDNNLDKFNIFGVKLEDLFSSNDEDENLKGYGNDIIDKKFEETKFDSAPNSDDNEDKDILNNLLICDEILEKLEADIEIDHDKLELIQKDIETRSNRKSSFKQELVDKSTKADIKNSPIILKNRSTSTPLGKTLNFNQKIKDNLKYEKYITPLNSDNKTNKSVCNLNQALNDSASQVNQKSTNSLIKPESLKINQNNQITFEMKTSLADLFNDDEDDDQKLNDFLTRQNEELLNCQNDIITVNERSKSTSNFETKKIAIVKPLNCASKIFVLI